MVLTISPAETMGGAVGYARRLLDEGFTTDRSVGTHVQWVMKGGVVYVRDGAPAGLPDVLETPTVHPIADY